MWCWIVLSRIFLLSQQWVCFTLSIWTWIYYKFLYLNAGAVLGPGRGNGAQDSSFTRGPPVLGLPIIFAKITQIHTYLDFFAFPNFRKVANLRFPLSIEKPKVLQLQGDLPLTLWPGALPLDLANGSAPRPLLKACATMFHFTDATQVDDYIKQN